MGALWWCEGWVLCGGVRGWVFCGGVGGGCSVVV